MMLGQAKLSHDELLTALVEVEMVLNSRPLTVVSTEDLEEPLTPSHLIMGRRLMDAPEPPGPEPDEFEVNCDVITKRARHLRATIDQFWQRWRKEYLVGLREMHSQRKKNSCAPRITVGDVVVIHDDQPRAMWKLGKVEELLTGADGEHRAAVLRVAGEGRSSKYLRRPVQKLYPLEMSLTPNRDNPNSEPELEQISESSSEPHTEPNMERDPDPDLNPPARRSGRVAAQTARDRLMAQALEEVDDEGDEADWG